MSGGIGSDFCASHSKAIASIPAIIIDRVVIRNILVRLLLDYLDEELIRIELPRLSERKGTVLGLRFLASRQCRLCKSAFHHSLREVLCKGIAGHRQVECNKPEDATGQSIPGNVPGFERLKSQHYGDERAPDQPVHFHSLRRLSYAATSRAAEDAENTE